MRTARRFLVTVLVPALIVSIFAVGAASAHGSGGKVNVCHWANHKFVKISVSTNAQPAHLKHGDVEPDEYGDCTGGEGDEEGSHGGHDGHDGDSKHCQGSRAKSSHGHGGGGWSGKGSGSGQRSGGHDKA